MIIYLVVFFISVVLTYWAEKYFENSYMKKGVALSILAILLPALLAGFRSSTIGTDVEYYALPAFNKALTSSYLAFVKNTSSLEIGYSTFLFLVTKLTGSFQMVLFLTHLIIIAFVYKFIYYNRKEVPMHLAMLVFFLFFYNLTLNIMRQSIAIAIILYCLALFENKKYLKTFLLLLVAILFHKSTIFCIPMFLLMWLIQRTYGYQRLTFLINIFIIALVVSSSSIIMILAKNNIIPARYYYYFYGYKSTEVNYKVFETTLKLLWVIMYILYQHIYQSKKLNIYFEFLLIDLILFPISYTITNAYRLSLAYALAGMLTIVPNLVNLFKKNKISMVGSRVFIFGVLLFYWYWMYVHHGYEETYPYELFIS